MTQEEWLGSGDPEMMLGFHYANDVKDAVSDSSLSPDLLRAWCLACCEFSGAELAVRGNHLLWATGNTEQMCSPYGPVTMTPAAAARMWSVKTANGPAQAVKADLARCVFGLPWLLAERMVWICESCGEVGGGDVERRAILTDLMTGPRPVIRCPSCKRVYHHGAKTTLGLTAHLNRDVKLLALSLRDRWDAPMLGVLADALEDARAEGLAVRHLRECDHHCLNCWVVREACGLDRPVFAYGGGGA